MSDKKFHRFLTPDILCDALQAAGFRVAEVKGADGEPILRSATGGLGFDVRLLNPLANEVGAFADASFQTAFQVRGELPFDLINRWHNTHRFSRLHVVDEWLLLNMDILSLGGVSPDNLRASVEIWDQLLQQLIAYLREELPKLAKAAPVAEPATEAVENITAAA